MQQYSTILLAVVTAAAFFLGAHAEWRPAKLKQCNLLHPSIIESLKNDTSVWGPGGITEDVVRSLHDPCKNEASAHSCIKSQRILIKNGTVYVTNLMPVNGFGYVELIGFLVELYEASQVYDLPDAEFAYWHDDNAPAETVLKEDGSCTWPYAPHKLPPIMAWAKFKGNGVMLVPYSGAFRCPSDSFDALAGQLQAMAETPWENRKPVGFGRWNAFCAWYYHGHLKFEDGKPMPCPREHIHHLSGNHSDILSARAMDKDLQRDKPVPLHDQHKFKYLVSTDGWSISSKFDKYLLMGSLIFKATGYTYGWYYAAMKAWEHYVPYMVKHENDLLDGLEWAKTHDAQAKKIAEAAQTFAMRNLNRQARLCYMFQLITELSKNFKYEISCDRREVCVPLVEEIKFLSKFDRTHRHCKYTEVLAPYASDDPAAHPGDSYYEELLAKHKAVPEHKWGGRRRRARRQR